MLTNLKRARLQKELTQTGLAQRSEVSRGTVWRLESLDNVCVKVGTINKLTTSLGCNVSQII